MTDWPNLERKRRAYGVTPEELVRATVDSLITGPDEEFEKAAEYVLKKNDELHNRLA